MSRSWRRRRRRATLPVTAAVLLAALLGLGVSVALWWVYFDVVALVAERVLARLEGEPRSRLARDSFTYLHFPMLVGIVYLALGMKKVLTYVADPEHHDLGDALPWVPLVALFGGAVLYLVALSALRRRNVGGWNVQRLVAAAVLLLLLPVGAAAPGPRGAGGAVRRAGRTDRLRGRRARRRNATASGMPARTEPRGALRARRARWPPTRPRPGHGTGLLA